MAKDKETGKDKTRHILTAAGEPLPIDPETGNIIADDLTDEQREILERAAARMVENAKNYAANLMKPNQEAIKAVNDALQPYIARVNELSKQLASVAISPDTREIIRDIINDLQPIQDLLNEIDDLKPYIVAELKKDEYGGMTLDDIVKHTPAELLEMRRDPGSLFYKAIEAARAAKDAAEPATIKRADIIEYPLDKPNSYIWNLLEKDTRGQIKFDMLPKKSQLQATAIYSINFDELSTDLKITKRLTPFDKRVYIAVSALFNAGNNVITLTQIYYAMGYTGRPNARDLGRINDALTKMSAARIYFDNEREAEAVKGYTRFKYDGSLLPVERLTAVVNGQMTNAAIRLFREPPLMSFAKQRQQITTISVKILQSPVNKTDANLQIDDYLLERIGKAKRGNGRSCRILYKTLFDRTGTTEKKQKQRTPAKVEKYLDYYQKQEHIKSYTMESDGVTIFF